MKFIINLCWFFILSACTSKIEIDGDAFKATQSSVVKPPLIGIQIVLGDKFIENLELQIPLINSKLGKLLKSITAASEVMKAAGIINSMAHHSTLGQRIIKKIK